MTTASTARGPAGGSARMRDWLASGRCQSPSGAFYAWVEHGSGKPAFEYPEITGYALTWLGGRADPSEAEIEAGRRAGAWLVARLGDGPATPARASWDDEAVYNFDLAMIAAGLISFGRRHDSERFVDSGIRVGSDLALQVAVNGELPPIRHADDIASRRSAWSTEGRAHLLKATQTLLLTAEYGISEASTAAETLVALAAELQDDDGRFVTHSVDRETMLHPHLYAVEGLYMWATARNDRAALERARAATLWAWRWQLESGGLPRFVPTAGRTPGPEQLDLTAQAVRAALMLGLSPAGLDRAVTRLLDVAVDGGGGLALPYQPKTVPVHLNAWVTMFGAQALELAAAAGADLDWRQLV